jgi:hypothetical protein
LEEANDKGDKKFNSDRIEDARLKYGNDAVTIAMRIAAGEDQGKILKEATEDKRNTFSLYLIKLVHRKNEIYFKTLLMQ